MPRRPAALPGHLHSGPFTVAKARADGVAPGRLEAADLTRPTSGVRSAMPVESTRDRARAYALVLPDGAIFSHQTAAELLELALPRRLEGGKVHICTPGDGGVVRRRGAVGHRGADRKRHVTVDGLPVASPEDTLVDLAPVLTIEELVQLGDAVLARSTEYVRWIPAVLQARRGARGVRTLREAMDLMRVGSASPMESLCRLRMREFGLPAPMLNHDVLDARGQWIACVDFCWPDRRVIVEYDGEVHAGSRQRRRDATRRRQLTLAGWTVVVITDTDLLRADWLRDLHDLLH